MKELVVISGKGGTGKTSLVASLAVLAKGKVLADADVDAADLHLILKPIIQHRETFKAGKKAFIRPQDCDGCGLCLQHCRFEAIKKTQDTCVIEPISCEGCGVCFHLCPRTAIDFSEKICGEWFISTTPYGPLVHARLGVAEENSGKLVTLVRTQAQAIAEREGLNLVIIDGSPGIGCPVIASITGSSLVLIVTEPTIAGAHDLRRVISLTRHFHLQTALCINKYDLNPSLTGEIEAEAKQHQVILAGRIHYDRQVTYAQVEGRAIVEYKESVAGEDLKNLWQHLWTFLQ